MAINPGNFELTLSMYEYQIMTNVPYFQVVIEDSLFEDKFGSFVI